MTVRKTMSLAEQARIQMLLSLSEEDEARMFQYHATYRHFIMEHGSAQHLELFDYLIKTKAYTNITEVLIAVRDHAGMND